MGNVEIAQEYANAFSFGQRVKERYSRERSISGLAFHHRRTERNRHDPGQFQLNWRQSVINLV